jgi:hypothetical protein
LNLFSIAHSISPCALVRAALSPQQRAAQNKPRDARCRRR